MSSRLRAPIAPLLLAALLVVAPTARSQFGGGGGVGGVRIDPDGVVQLVTRARDRSALEPAPGPLQDSASARAVSLRALSERLTAYENVAYDDLPPELVFLAGLVAIEEIVVDRARGDVLLVGPGEAWERASSGRVVGVSSGRATIHLSDLATALRAVLSGTRRIECSIEPTRSGLGKLRSYQIPAIRGPRDADRVRREVADLLGLQNVIVSGVDPASRFGHILVEADFQMKRLAIGVDAFSRVPNHLDAMVAQTEQRTTDRLLNRWWFRPAYKDLRWDADRQRYVIGQGRLVLLNERIGDPGSAGKQDAFAKAFTERFDELQKRFAVFSDLRNLFDLVLVGAVIEQSGAEAWLTDGPLIDRARLSIPRSTPGRFAEPLVAARVHTKRGAGRGGRSISYAFGGVNMVVADFLDPSLVPPSFLEPEGGFGNAIPAGSDRTPKPDRAADPEADKDDESGPADAFWADEKPATGGDT